MRDTVLSASRALERSDSVDKLMKLMVGVFTLLSTTSCPRRERYSASAKQLTEIRSVLRVGRVFGLSLKMQSLVEVFTAQGIVWTERKKFVEFLKIIFDFLYAVGDHALLVAREGLLGKNVDMTRLRNCTVTMQLCGHLLGTVLYLFELRDALRKCRYDPPVAMRKCKLSTINAMRDAIDTVVTLFICSYMRNAQCPSPRVDGALRCLSGALSVYLSWQESA
ncbi:glycosomal membrane protein-like protein [Leishmania panamensis]|uniref:Glycosomal membrane protein-like protein n=1 Tax=Leishmania panamensis TaxID=5679 RepID=A0A088RUN8_LEIPA|nr:glycosomal membrane protein-like protein [Leishmania panamensis]AIN99872.1 glycosomal membrane protein-like protein [Leishmania panamensis]